MSIGLLLCFARLSHWHKGRTTLAEAGMILPHACVLPWFSHALATILWYVGRQRLLGRDAVLLTFPTDNTRTSGVIPASVMEFSPAGGSKRCSCLSLCNLPAAQQCPGLLGCGASRGTKWDLAAELAEIGFCKAPGPLCIPTALPGNAFPCWRGM